MNHLRSVGVGSSVCHGQDSCSIQLQFSVVQLTGRSCTVRGHTLTWPCVLQLEVLISKFLAIDRLSTSAISLGEVTTLHSTTQTFCNTIPAWLYGGNICYTVGCTQCICILQMQFSTSTGKLSINNRWCKVLYRTVNLLGNQNQQYLMVRKV